MKREATWQKFDALSAGYSQFYYLYERDVQPATGREMLSPWSSLRDAVRRWRGRSMPTWDEAYRGLNKGRKMAVRLYGFTAELNNGGLATYFWNSTGSHAAEQITDFCTVGCPDAAAVLAAVVQVCRQSPTLSEAGRTLFSVTREKKKNANDADRLRKYLARFGLSWRDCTSQVATTN